MKAGLFAGLGLGLLACNLALADIHINDYNEASNNRFGYSGSFILKRYDLSGVGQGDTGSWGTLVSPNVVVSAAHASPAVGSRMFFYLINDPKAEPVVRKVTSVVSGIGNTDLSLAVLNAPVDGAKYYDIADEFLTGPLVVSTTWSPRVRFKVSTLTCSDCRRKFRSHGTTKQSVETSSPVTGRTMED